MEADKELCRLVSRQDAKAFDELMRRHLDAVKMRLVRMVRDDSAADDLAQEVFLRLWQRGRQYNGKGSFKAWLMQIATNIGLNHLRSARRRRARGLQAAPGPDSGRELQATPSWLIDESALGPYELADMAEQCELLRRMVQALPEPKRQILRLVHEEEMGLSQVAELMGIPIGTVKSRLHYTLGLLGRQWREVYRQWENDE